MKQLSLPLFAFIIGTSSLCHAATVPVEATGEGTNVTEAINAALSMAVGQVSGVHVSAVNQSLNHFQKSSKEGNQYDRQTDSGVQTSTQGQASYRVLSEHCQNNHCKVRLQVAVKVDDTAKRHEQLKALNANRRTIGIKAFSGAHGQQLSNNLQTLFVQDRKFSVLNDLHDSNLDYLLTGKVVQASTQKKVVDHSRVVALTGEKITDVQTFYDSKVVIDYQLVDKINNQIKWQTKVVTSSKRNNLNQLIELSANKVFTALKDNIYPLILISTDNGKLLVNSGGESVKKGEKLAVYAMGKKIIDPVTKESLGYSETQVGKVEVTQVLPKLAYVKLVSGNLAQFGKFPVLRKIPQAVHSARATAKHMSHKPAAKPQETMGIVL